METIALSSAVRTPEQNARDLRSVRRIPAVVYGHDVANTTLSLDRTEFLRVYRAAGQSHLVALDLGGTTKNVLIYDVQFDPVTDDFLHVDLLAVSATEKISVSIPLSFIGESEAVRQ